MPFPEANMGDIKGGGKAMAAIGRDWPDLAIIGRMRDK